MKEIYALGVGHGTPIFIELAEACGYRVGGLYHYNDSRTGESDHGFPILGSFDDLLHSTNIEGMNFVLTMGDMNIKRVLSKKLYQKGGVLPSLIHPQTNISRFSHISECGVLICSQCEVHSDAVIDEGCVLWHRATIEHDTHLYQYVFVGPNAYIGAYTEVGNNAFIGQCSVLVSDKAKSIGAYSLVGAGSLVTKPVPDKVIVAGSPARIFSKDTL